MTIAPRFLDDYQAGEQRGEVDAFRSALAEFILGSVGANPALQDGVKWADQDPKAYAKFELLCEAFDYLMERYSARSAPTMSAAKAKKIRLADQVARSAALKQIDAKKSTS